MRNYIPPKRAASFGLLALLTLVRCGGGSVDIQPQEDRTDATTSAIQSLATAPDETSRTTVLADLRGRRGDLADWALFWSLLQNKPELVSRLLPAHEEALFALHVRACSEKAFRSFATFALANRAGWDHLLGDKRVCETSLGPELAIRIFKTYSGLKPLAAKSPHELEQSLGFLTKEMERLPTADWAAAYSSADLVEIGAQAAKLIAAPAAGRDAVADFAIGYRQVTRSLPFPSILEESFLLDARFVRAYARKRGRDETTKLLLQIVDSGMSKYPLRYTSRSLLPALTVLTADPFSEIEFNWELAWEHYRDLKSLILRASNAPGRAWPLIERLKILNGLQADFESWWERRNLSPAQAEVMVERWTSELGDTPELLDAAWFALRLLSHGEAGVDGWTTNPRIDALAARVKALPSVYAEVPDRVLAARLRVHLADTMAEKKTALADFCALLPAQKHIEKRLRADFRAELERGVEPGCFSLSGLSDRRYATVPPAHELKTSFDTALLLPYGEFLLRAQNIALGIVDLSAPSEIPSGVPAASFDLKTFALGHLTAFIGRQGGRLHLTLEGPSVKRLKRFAFISQGRLNPATGFRGWPGLWTLDVAP